MKIRLITIGKTDREWLREGMNLYMGRLKHYIPFEFVEIPDLKNTASMTQDAIKQKEGELLLGKIAPTEHVILLDEKGKELRSIEFAKKIENRMNSFSNDMVFIIGGAYGFSEAVYARSNEKLSLSQMTFSHQMVRVIFTEQLYRAFTIIKGEPYHHE